MRFLGGAAVAAAVVAVLTGCGSQAAQPSYSPSVTVVTSTAPAPSTPAPVPSTSAPDGPASSGPQPSGSATEADPERPGDQCADSAIGVGIRTAPGGGGAGSEFYELVFTNTGGETCTLRGAPGVSVVGGGNGTQIGPAAKRDQGDAATLRLSAGDTVIAPLQVVNIGSNGGPLGSGCGATKGEGYRVYPPHSTRAFFVKDASAVACAKEQFMTVGVLKPQS